MQGWSAALIDEAKVNINRASREKNSPPQYAVDGTVLRCPAAGWVRPRHSPGIAGRRHLLGEMTRWPISQPSLRSTIHAPLYPSLGGHTRLGLPTSLGQIGAPDQVVVSVNGDGRLASRWASWRHRPINTPSITLVFNDSALAMKRIQQVSSTVVPSPPTSRIRTTWRRRLRDRRSPGDSEAELATQRGDQGERTDADRDPAADAGLHTALRLHS